MSEELRSNDDLLHEIGERQLKQVELEKQIKELNKAVDEHAPEAVYSFSTNGLTRDELGGNWTIRARPGENGQTFFHRVDNFLQYAIAHGWKLPPAPQQAPAPQQTMTPTIPGATPQAPAPTAERTEGACTAILMKVGKSFKGDKPQLIFEVKEQTDALKFTGKTVDDLIKFLAPVGQYTAAHLVNGAKFNIDYILRWRKSDDNKYQNIVAIER
jgi:hypothetical protein